MAIENKISTMKKNWNDRFEEVQKTLKKIGKNIMALKIYDQFTLNTSCFWDIQLVFNLG